MFKNEYNSKEAGIYIYIQESGSNKTKKLNEFLKDINKNELFIKLDYQDLKGGFRYEQIKQAISSKIKTNRDIKNIFIDGLFDNMSRVQMRQELEYLSNANKKVFILSNNNELFFAYSHFLKANKLDDKENILVNQNGLSWQMLYVGTYWKSLVEENGNLKLNGKKVKMNEADFVALLIASRYWGYASFIFKVDFDTNKNYYEALSRSMFHVTQLDMPIDDFLNKMVIPSTMSRSKIKTYLSVKGLLAFNEDNIKLVIQDMSCLQIINFDLVMHAIIGRHIIESKSALIPKDKLKEYRNVINDIAHAADYVITNLISKNREKSLEVFNFLEALK